MTRSAKVIDPRAHVMMITHGHRACHRFQGPNSKPVPVHLQISINAANAATPSPPDAAWRRRLRPGSFESARWARSSRPQRRILDGGACVTILDQVPALLRLSEELGVSGVYLRTLIPGNFYAARFDDEATFDSYAAWGHPDFERTAGRAAGNDRPDIGPGLYRHGSVGRAAAISQRSRR